jgi:hypothetical protein
MKTKSLQFDIVCWIFVMVLAGVIAFSLLQRDKNRQFGSIAYGGLPRFSLKTIEDKDFDYLKLKRAVWAIHMGSSREGEHLASELSQVAQATASGKRHLNILTFIPEEYQWRRPVHPFQHVLRGTTQELNHIFGKLNMNKQDIVLLVDQDGTIRGRFDFSSPDDFRRFRQDLMSIL